MNPADPTAYREASASLPRSTPAEQGISPKAILAFLEAVEGAGLELHSLMLLRHGRVVAEGWWTPYASRHPHLLYSLSKSFTATAAGLAIAEGRIALDDTVLPFFPESAPTDPGQRITQLRLRHLLTMTTGHTDDTLSSLFKREDGDWAAAFLSQPLDHEPGTHFRYNSGATYMVSAIVQKVTGEPIISYLRPRLLDPLGIAGDAEWETDGRGVNVGGWGLSLRTEDIARFGELYLRRGIWNGRRLLPEAWVDEATAGQVSNGDRDGEGANSDWAQGYGYQFWRCRHGAYRGDGAFGQFCVVMPDQDAVLAMTGNVTEMQAVLDLVWEHLLPALSSDPAPLAHDNSDQELLERRLSSLTLEAPTGQAESSLAPALSGRTFYFPPNDQGIESLTLAPDISRQGDSIFTIQDSEGFHTVLCGGPGAATENGTWRDGRTTFRNRHVSPARTSPGGSLDVGHRVAAAGAWTAEDTFTARLCFYETPFTPLITCGFLADGEDHFRLKFAMQGRVGFGTPESLVLSGRSRR